MSNLVLAVEQLTPREDDVLQELATGVSNAAIAVTLFTTEATVKTHLLHLYAKLGADSRLDAVIQAHRLGLVTLPGDEPPEVTAVLALEFAKPGTLDKARAKLRRIGDGDP